jgi:hypothetical protein
MDFIKKIVLELWCMAYGVGLFILATWPIALSLGVCVLFVAIPRKKRNRAS